MKKSSLLLIIFISFLISLLLVNSCSRVSGLDDPDMKLGLIFTHGKDFRITRDLKSKGGGKSRRSLEAKSGKKLLKIEMISGLSESQANLFIDERISMINSLFSNIPSPYPGAVTHEVEVDQKLLPQKRTLKIGGKERQLLILVSNDRYTYSAMAKELVVYRGGLLFLYNSSTSTLYRFDYFIPADDFAEKELLSFFSGIKFAGSTDGPGESEKGVEKKTASAYVPEAVGDATSASLRQKGRNLILIAFEPLGANHVGTYGYPKNTTPNLDRFAKDSLVFEDAISPSSWSLPVFMSWFTSMYPSQHRVLNKYSVYTESEQVIANLAELSPSAVTLAQVFRKNGYRTAAFTGGSSLGAEFGFPQGFDTFVAEKNFGGFDATMAKARDWLEKNRNDKFFLFVQGYDVHGKFPLNPEDLDRFLDKPYKGESKGSEEEYWALRDRNLEEGKLSLPSEELRFLKAVYDAKIYAADKRFGDFIAYLNKMGLLDNSVIVVSSGSGNEYLEHNRIDHGHSLYEELIHVPLLIRIPGGVPGRIGALVRTIDIMPTVIDLLGLKEDPAVMKQMRGATLVPLISGEPEALDAVSETDYLLRSFKKSIKTHDGWKLIISLDSEKRELYNLNEDPHEQHNLIDRQPRLAYELEQKLFAELK